MAKGKKQQYTATHQLRLRASIFLFILISALTAYYLSHYLKPLPGQPVVELTMASHSGGEGFFLNGKGAVFSSLLTQPMDKAELIVRSEHQSIDVYVDESLIFSTPYTAPDKDPGLALYYVPLNDYLGKTLYMVVNSPSKLFSASLQDVYMGTPSGLRAYSFSTSLPYMVIMLICVLGGIVFVIAALRSRFRGPINYSNFFLGIFSIVWGLNGTSDTLITYSFFSPVFLSGTATFLHYLNPLPLGLFVYFRLTRYRKWATPFVFLLIACFFTVLAAPLFKVSYVNISQYISPVYQAIFLCIMLLSIFDIFAGNGFLKKVIPFAIPLLIATVIQVIDFYTLSFSTSKIRLMSYICYFILIIGVWTLSAVDFYRLWRKIEVELDAIALRNNMITNSYAAILRKNEAILAIKHELKHVLATIQMLLAKPNVEEAKDYLAGLSAWDLFDEAKFSDNHLINAIIAETDNQCKAQDIACQWNLAVPDTLKLNINTLISILMNLLDNAVEASILLPIEQRFIKLTMHIKKKYLYIRCENSARLSEQALKGYFPTTKENAASHGIGLHIIHRLVEENDGLINIETKEGSFTATVALLLD